MAIALLPPAEDTPNPEPRDRTFFALPSGGILETHGDLSQSQAAARWDEHEAARRARWERDRAAWLERPADHDPAVGERRGAERAAWMARHAEKWRAREEEIASQRAVEREEWLDGHAAKWNVREAEAYHRRATERAAWSSRKPAKRKRRKKKLSAAARQRIAARRAQRRSAWIAKHATRWATRIQVLRDARAAERTTWLDRHAARWDARAAKIAPARSAERSAWSERHAAKWNAREASDRARAARAIVAWVKRSTEPPKPADDAQPDVVRDMWRKRHAWEKRRDRLLAPFRPRPFQAVIVTADAVPAIVLCEADCQIPPPHVHTAVRKRGALVPVYIAPDKRTQSDLPTMRWAWPVKGKTIMGRALTRREQQEVVELKKYRSLHVLRPQTRGECVDGPRPCPWVTCQYHLYVDVSAGSGSLKINFPGRSVAVALRAMKDTCALDVADRGGVTLDDVGDVINVSMERVRQLVEAAVEELAVKIDPNLDPAFLRKALEHGTDEVDMDTDIDGDTDAEEDAGE